MFTKFHGQVGGPFGPWNFRDAYRFLSSFISCNFFCYFASHVHFVILSMFMSVSNQPTRLLNSPTFYRYTSRTIEPNILLRRKITSRLHT